MRRHKWLARKSYMPWSLPMVSDTFDDSIRHTYPHLPSILMSVEARHTSGQRGIWSSESPIGSAVFIYQYDTPTNPAGEQYCRGQF